MSKRTPFLFFIILIVSTIPLPKANALRAGPPYLELDLLPDGSNSTTVYVTSEGLSGELIVGREDLPFRVEPSKINMTSSDVNVPVELTFYGNETLEPGVYIGLVTFYADTGSFIAYRIRLWVTINLLDETQEIQEEEPEMSVEGESEEETELIADEEKPEEELEAETESESEEEPEPESQEMDYTPYVMGVAAVAALVSVIIWWKRR